jgi:transposase-like protein
VHKTANILNKVALSVQANMKKDLREVYLVPSRASAKVAIDVFVEKYRAKYDKAVECLTKDRDTLLALYDFAAEPYSSPALRVLQPSWRQALLAWVRARPPAASQFHFLNLALTRSRQSSRNRNCRYLLAVRKFAIQDLDNFRMLICLKQV